MSSRTTCASEARRAKSPHRQRSRERTHKELQLAIVRIKNKGLKLSILAVANEAGVSAGLIHNTYPEIAEQIRSQIGRTTRQQRDAKAAELMVARLALKTMRAELAAARSDISRLASINETLRQEVTVLRSAMSGEVAVLPRRGSV